MSQVARRSCAKRTARGRLSTALALALLAASVSGCSLRKLAVGTLADALAGSSAGFASDEDPELIRDALPFALKTIETLLSEVPENRGLLLSACQGFVLYGAGFVEPAADRLEETSYRQAKRQHERVLKLYLRARGYCFRALELAYPGSTETLIRAPGEALAKAGREDVKLLYWTAGSWGSAIAAGLDRPELVADLPAVRALLEKALALDPQYDRGALHEAMMLVELAEVRSGSGSVERAREHFERALALNGGQRAGTYVAWAEAVAVQEQDRAEFERLLAKALAVDPDRNAPDRLANVIYQERARWLLDRADELFLDGFEDDAVEDGGLPEGENLR